MILCVEEALNHKKYLDEDNFEQRVYTAEGLHFYGIDLASPNVRFEGSHRVLSHNRRNSLWKSSSGSEDSCRRFVSQ